MSNDNTIELKAIEGKSQGQLVFERFLSHKVAIVSIFVFAAILILAVTSVGYGPIPGWWKWKVYETSPLDNTIGEPSADHPFGQDNIGNDIFALTMRGVQQSITVMILMSLIATVLGVIIGAMAGYYRGKLDTVLMRVTDGFITVPSLVVGAVLGRVFHGATAVSLGIVFGFIIWMGMARLVRAEFLTLREREFVDAAKVAGASDFRIIFHHILPNTIGVIIVNTTLLMSSSILLETGLSFLGFGIQWPDVSLGNIISQNQSTFQTRPWLFWWPGLFIVLIALCANFIGDGLRDAFDPSQKRIPSKAKMMKALISRGVVSSSDYEGSNSTTTSNSATGTSSTDIDSGGGDG